MQSVKGDGVELNLAKWPGNGKTLLCIHGLTANCRCWDAVAEAMDGRHRVLALDLRGRGHSQRPQTGYSIERHCSDLCCLMNDLGLDRVVAVGHSLGASIALEFAARHPERVERTILVDGAGKLSGAQMKKVFAGIKPALDRLGRVFPTFEAYIEPLKQAPFLQPWSQRMEAYFRHEVERVDGGVRSRVPPDAIAEEIRNLQSFDVAARYSALRCPVLILRATEGMLAAHDILLPEPAVARMLRKIPDAACVDVPGANHYSIVFQDSGVRDRSMLAFLS
jgi:pimeloyl-ACP methyl ester carboxylesterase